MSDLKSALENRFGTHRVTDFPTEESDYIDLIQVDIETNIPLRLIMTNGLSSYNMPVPERYKGREYTEIFFCIPGYWDFEDKENEAMQWPLNTIQKLAKNVLENETWYGPGHTIANGNPVKEISATMKQNHFLLADPIEVESYLTPLEVDGNKIYFLAIIPLFYNEFERKMGKGYPKWIRKFRQKKGNEILDDYRQSIYRSRWLKR